MMVMKKLGLLSISFLLIWVLSSCDLLINRAAKQYDLALTPKELSVAQGESKTFTLEVKPLTGSLTVATTEVELTTSLPTGITLEPDKLSIATGEKASTITVTVAKTAALIQDLELEFKAVRDGLAVYSSLSLSVTESSQ
jgi:hypothetical protein